MTKCKVVVFFHIINDAWVQHCFCSRVLATVFDKLDAELAKAILSIGAVKGIEFGAGFSAASMLGSEHNDEMDKSGFLSNHSGGILGGISTGQEIIFRISVKPTSSISVTQRTLNVKGEEQDIRTEGRND